MKKLGMILLLVMSIVKVDGQSQEAQQLLLDVEKLAQFKQILADLKQGYEVISKGYTTIRDISQGNFNLHDQFLDALLEISPAVRNYKKIADIISMQLRLVKEYRSAWNRFQSGGGFSVNELDHISKVYTNLVTASLHNLDDLLMVITARQLRMSDDERLAAIDQIYGSMQDKLIFLRQFNSSTAILNVQRAREQKEVNVMRKLYDLK